MSKKEQRRAQRKVQKKGPERVLNELAAQMCQNTGLSKTKIRDIIANVISTAPNASDLQKMLFDEITQATADAADAVETADATTDAVETRVKKRIKPLSE